MNEKIKIAAGTIINMCWNYLYDNLEEKAFIQNLKIYVKEMEKEINNE